MEVIKHQEDIRFRSAIVTGCGSKYGLVILKQILHRFDSVELYTSQKHSDIDLPLKLKNKLHTHTISWEAPVFKPNDRKYDLVFFNHNSSPQDFSLQNYHTDVLWTQDIIDKLHKHEDLKVGWMITAGIISPPDWFEYAPYFHMKHSRLYLMYFMQYLHPGKYFAVDPGEPSQWTDIERKQQAIHLAEFMLGSIEQPGTLYKAVYHNGKVQPPEFNWKLEWTREQHETGDPFIYD